jgi:hypothetical protein
MARTKELSVAAQIEAANVEAAAEEAAAAEEQDGDALEIADLELVEESKSRIRLPLIEGAVVVYKGSRKNQNIAYVGRVYVNEVETGDKNAKGEPVMYVTKECTDEGTHSYSFMTHDLRGRLIQERMTPVAGEQKKLVGSGVTLSGSKLPPDLRGRPYAGCEHPEHLRMFMRTRNANKEREFDILIPARVRPTFDQYVARKENALRIADQYLQDTVSRS